MVNHRLAGEGEERLRDVERQGTESRPFGRPADHDDGDDPLLRGAHGSPERDWGRGVLDLGGGEMDLVGRGRRIRGGGGGAETGGAGY